MIKKYEHNPIPSHPKKNWIKLSEDTNSIIKNENIDNKDINLQKKGSLFIYSNEKIITKKETSDTVKIIIEDKKSIDKLQYIFKIPILNQYQQVIKKNFPLKIEFNKKKIENKKTI